MKELPSAQRSITEKFANPFIAAQRGYIDDVIMPAQYYPAKSGALAGNAGQ